MRERLLPLLLCAGLAAALFARTGDAHLEAQWAGLLVLTAVALAARAARTPLPSPGWWLLLWTAAGAAALVAEGAGPSGWASLLLRDGLWLGAWWLAPTIREGLEDGPPELPGLAAGVIMAVVAVGWLQWVGALPAAFNAFGERDLKGALGLSNFTAEWAVVATLLLTGLWAGRDASAARRWLLVAAVPVVGFAAVAGARTALAAVAAAVVVPFLLAGGRAVRYVWFLGLAALAGIALMWLDGDAPLRYRLMLADQALTVVGDAPFGVGPGRISEGLDRVLAPELDRVTWEIENAITHAHNLFVEALAERGWAGLAILVLFALWWLERAAEARARGETWLVAAGAAWWVVALGSLASAVAPHWWTGAAALALVASPGRQADDFAATARGTRRSPAAVLLALLLVIAAAFAWHRAGTARWERASVRLLQEGRPADAETALRKALARSPEDALMLYRLGQLRIIQGNTVEALAEFARAAAARPTWARAWEATTLAAADAGRFADALAAAEVWVDMPGWRDPVLWHATASSAWAIGRREEAAAWIAAGLAEHPGDAVLLRLRASIAALEGRWADAETDYAAVAEGPDGTPRDRELADMARRRR